MQHSAQNDRFLFREPVGDARE